YAQQIAESLQLTDRYDHVLEVGPGQGMLTKHLLARSADFSLTVSEADKDMVAYLEEHYPELGERIVAGDFLRAKLRELFDGAPFGLIGNYPYNISSQIIFKMLDNYDLIPEMSGMFQKEVADRIVAGSGSKTYGVVGVLTQARYTGKVILNVGRGNFNPPPRVESAVIRLVRRDEPLVPDELWGRFKHIVKSAFGMRRKMHNPLFFPADAHEGPVWVPDQRRLYYATKTHLDGRRRVDVEFIDFSSTDPLEYALADQFAPHPWRRDANMANGMRLHRDGRHLLVAEQGDESRPAAVALLDLTDGKRTVLVDHYGGKRFNSINKVIQSKNGHLIFSDPDYGWQQGFKPQPELEPMLYVLPFNGELTPFRCGLQIPHGLALSADEQTLFVSDTSDDDYHNGTRKSVWKFPFDPDSGTLSGPGTCCFAVAEGVPDGMTTTEDYLLVGGGDGIYVADHTGRLLHKIPLERAAVNLTLARGGSNLFVTADDGVYLFLDWKRFLGADAGTGSS
ncbi:MAG: 16S rRNA (adenine(1518)-N(6)/adenine(1519)-N(6))-dimethyltransferase RsmA, partial [Bacteroidota bacterium]